MQENHEPVFVPTADELFEAISMLLIASAPEISKKTIAKIRVRMAFLMQARDEQGQVRISRSASALLSALGLQAEWPKEP